MGKRAITVVLVLILFVFFGAFILWVMGERIIPPPSVKGSLELMTGTRVDTTLLSSSPSGTLSNVSFNGEGIVVSRTRRPEINMTVSAVTPFDGFGTALFLETSEESRVLAEPDQVRDTPSISFDGTLLAYAELAVPFGETTFSENVSNWHVYVMDIASGEREDIGVGYAPYFISNDPNVLVYSAPDGIASYVINGSERAWMSDGHPTSLTDRAVIASPGGERLAAYNPLTRHYTVYEITQSYPLQLSAIGEPQFGFEQVVLSDSHLFGITYNDGDGSYTLWRIANADLAAPFSEGGEPLYNFTDGEIPYQLIP